jgi:hypothetical protein
MFKTGPSLPTPQWAAVMAMFGPMNVPVQLNEPLTLKTA